MDIDTRSLILIVDDAPVNLRVLSQALGDEYRIAAVTSGAEALECMDETLPDLVLLDVMMPDMDGYEVCRRFKADPKAKNVPVIFLTAKESDEDQLTGFELGAVDYVTKPFSVPVVKARIHTHLELKRYREMLESMAWTDALTCLPNRRRLDDFYEFIWYQSRRSAAPLSVIMIDIDQFKQFNDHYGHLVGDDCLRSVAKAMDLMKRRNTDLLARYGGEEFVFILPSTKREHAILVAESLRKAVQDLALPHECSDAANVVTISLGVATRIPVAECDSNSLITLADQALYLAKERGRNRVQACEVDVAPGTT